MRYFVNNFMILEIFLALEHYKSKQNIYLRFSSFVAYSLKQKIKNKELLYTKLCTAFCSIVTASCKFSNYLFLIFELKYLTCFGSGSFRCKDMIKLNHN